MFDKAIDKIRDEMAANADSSYIQYVGGFLTDHLQRHPEDATAILAEGKTIDGSMKEMEKYARDHKSGNCAVVSDQDGFRIVMEYFGIGEKADNEAKNANVCGFDIGLDSLLDD